MDFPFVFVFFKILLGLFCGFYAVWYIIRFIGKGDDFETYPFLTILFIVSMVILTVLIGC